MRRLGVDGVTLTLKDLDDAYQVVGELVDIVSEGNLVSVLSRI